MPLSETREWGSRAPLLAILVALPTLVQLGDHGWSPLSLATLYKGVLLSRWEVREIVVGWHSLDPDVRLVAHGVSPNIMDE